MSLRGWLREGGKEKVEEARKKAKTLKRRDILILGGMAFGASSFATDVSGGKYHGFHATLFLVLFAGSVLGWALWRKANKSGKAVAIAFAVMGFFVSGSPSTKVGHSNGEEAWAAMSGVAEILDGMSGAKLRAGFAAGTQLLATLWHTILGGLSS